MICNPGKASTSSGNVGPHMLSRGRVPTMRKLRAAAFAGLGVCMSAAVRVTAAHVATCCDGSGVFGCERS